MNLQLPLIKKWFEMTKSGIKTEDYREITEYWFKRLCTGINNRDSKSKGAYYILCNYLNSNSTDEANKHLGIKMFTTNTMTLGYPNASDSERILKLEHKGIEIRTGNPEWGAEADKLYFVIKHGRIL